MREIFVMEFIYQIIKTEDIKKDGKVERIHSWTPAKAYRKIEFAWNELERILKDFYIRNSEGEIRIEDIDIDPICCSLTISHVSPFFKEYNIDECYIKTYTIEQVTLY